MSSRSRKPGFGVREPEVGDSGPGFDPGIRIANPSPEALQRRFERRGSRGRALERTHDVFDKSILGCLWVPIKDSTGR